MNHAFDLLREEMRNGFDGLHRRLDIQNGRVNEHGESIAMLRQGCLANASLSQEVHEIAQSFSAHRARCPYDGMGEATPAANARWTTGQLAGGIAGGGAGMIVLFRLAEWVVEQLR